MAELDPQFLALLCCPVTRKPLVQKGDWLISTDPESRLRYPIRDDIPVLLQEESEAMDQAAWEAAVAGTDTEPTHG